ncbi:hypothetical protein SRB5_24370 [Streptomyces sp. RB5]|uniref:Broad specificity phosphatase PhoE n=1 Tax=Streptomyces smaragdinus TaxID=2585196 RepID=A0A7K0CHT1_9ACTN|nr:histidine phosphatase family protein [Streptomyces smaragdinus]MQY12304.1 hypothetical protein [Streptomyces smaragdinus]
MTAQVTLVTPATSWEAPSAVLGADGPLDEAGRKAAGEAGAPRADRTWCGPEVRCRETAEALGVPGTAVAELAGWDLGEWRGRTRADLAAECPGDLEAWLTDPDAAPHGGESLTGLLARTGRWLDTVPAGHTVAVTDQALVRAAVVSALSLPARSFWLLDAAPLSATVLTARDGQWHLRCGSPSGDGS